MSAICGLKQSESFGYYDQDTASWRTCQVSLILDISGESSLTFPKAGMMSNGVLSELTMSEPRREGKGCGYWPTPTASERSGINPNTGKGEGLSKAVKMWPTPATRDYKGANSAAHIAKGGRAHMGQLPNAVAHGGTQTRQIYSTPTSTMSNRSEAFKKGRLPQPQEVAKREGGQLNPDWVEWLMGWPRNWTTLKPICIFNYYEYIEKHGISAMPKEVQSRKVRNVSEQKSCSTPPQGRKLSKQQSEKHSDCLSEVPHQDPCPLRELGEGSSPGCGVQCLWFSFSAKKKQKVYALWKSGMLEGKWQKVSRVAVGVKDRINRLKAIGNGQVPAVAAAAWRILTQGVL